MSQDREHVRSWIGLSSIPGIGRVTFRRLIAHFGSARRVLAASQGELRESAALSEKVCSELRSFPWQERADEELAKADAAGVAIITADDPGYPGPLLNTPDPPLFLYIRGSLLPEDGSAVAMVGTRTPTHYGLTVTHRMAYELASQRITVVSGMARGIDTQAHKGALAAKGRTIAVLGCGIDTAYPRENKGLMEDIVRSGAVVTENPFGTKPESGYFPARNRIISGLAAGTVIIEAAEDSGSLITADYALKQGRKLFAVPGNISSHVSRGTNSLIRQGAVLVGTAGDVLQGLDLYKGSEPPAATDMQLPPLTPEEASVFKTVTNEPKHIDAIMAESSSTPGRLSGLLITLELKGLVKQLPGKYFVRDLQ
ncbi:MAG: DNA-processing protein DprA [Nitrospirota bacterium]